MADSRIPSLDLSATNSTPFKRTMASAQIARVQRQLEVLRHMYIQRIGSLWALLELLARIPGCAAPLLGPTRRVLLAAVGTTDLRGWEAGASRDQVELVLERAIAFCDPTKRRWLEVSR